MLIHHIINLFSYILPFLPLAILIIFLIRSSEPMNVLKLLLLIFIALLLGCVLFYSRFIEPNTVKVNNVNIETGFKSKIILISDLHIGVYSSSSFLEKVVNEINKIQEVDFVVIAGDITYYPSKDLDKLLEPLTRIDKQTYLVLGNHDSGQPGPYIESELIQIFSQSRMKLLKNESIYIENLNLHLVGLGDLWAREAEVDKLNEYSKEENLLVIAHTPDTVYKYKSNIADLTLSGHTHGGQIRIPYIYKFFIPTKFDFDQGLYNTNKGQVYVSSGIGISGLPFRFRIPPSIDIINTY